MTALWFEGEHPRKKGGRGTILCIRASKQGRLPIPLEGRAGQEVEKRKARKSLRELGLEDF